MISGYLEHVWINEVPTINEVLTHAIYRIEGLISLSINTELKEWYRTFSDKQAKTIF